MEENVRYIRYIIGIPEGKGKGIGVLIGKGVLGEVTADKFSTLL